MIKLALFCLLGLQICRVTPRMLRYNFQLDSESLKEETAAVKYPYMASISLYGTFRCAGVILNNNWILTVASCVKWRQESDINVRVGSIYNNAGGNIFSVEKVVNHDQFDRTSMEYDYSLVKVSSPMEYSENISKIDIADESLNDNKKAIVVGWSDSKTYTASDAVTVHDDDCKDDYRNYGYSVQDNTVCAKSQSDECHIDNGDPLIYNNIVYGIFSWSLNCQDARFPGVYSNVAEVNDWINKNIN